MSDSLIPSFLVSDVSESPRSLTKMSNVSKSLRSLTKNEPMSESLVFLSEFLICSFFSQKTRDSLRKPMSEFPALLHRKGKRVKQVKNISRDASLFSQNKVHNFFLFPVPCHSLLIENVTFSWCSV